MNSEQTQYQSKEMQIENVQQEIALLSGLSATELQEHKRSSEVFSQFLELLNKGSIRAAQKDEGGNWQVNEWVKTGILIGFRLGKVASMSNKDEALQFFDKDTYPLKEVDGVSESIRVVPGGTAIRTGSFVDRGVVLMPPSYINVGAYVGENTMLDSHSLVGSCAQVGERCHISAGAQVGGVLEPINASPCIIEDEVIMGINTSIAEGVILKERVVLAPGVQITSATPVFDVVREKIYSSENGSLIVPEGAVVVPGVRFMSTESDFTRDHGLMIQTPIIRKYRDTSTDAKTAIEESLRN